MYYFWNILLITTEFLVLMTVLADGNSASEPKYPIFERTQYRGLTRKNCVGDKELVWVRSKNGEQAYQLCRQKCRADWIQTKQFCIQSNSVSFPQQIRRVSYDAPCAGSEYKKKGWLTYCIEECPAGMTENEKWCIGSQGKDKSAVNGNSKCDQGFDKIKMKRRDFCAKPIQRN